MTQIFSLPKVVPVDSAGTPYGAAKLYFYRAGTTTDQAVYTTSALSVAHAQPVLADASGTFPTIYLNPSASFDYRIQVKTAGDVLIYDQDNIPKSGITLAELLTYLTQSVLGQVLYPRTAAEIAAGVTPTNYAWPPGHRSRYATLADAVAVAATHPLLIYASETITAHITVPTGFKAFGFGLPTITNSTAGDHVFDAVSKSNLVIDGINFAGANSSTTPSSTFTGGAATDTGLVTFNLCTDVRITNCGFSTFYNGFCAIRTQRLWFTKNRITHWLKFAIQAAEASGYWIDYNEIVGTDATGASESYGVHATGDSANSNPSTYNSISFNQIRDIACWDGIMTHEAFGLRIIGNDIRNVRNGIDVGASGSTPDLKDIHVIGNYIKSTTTDTYSGAAAHHTGIILNGKNSTYLAKNIVCSGNTVDGFFGATGITSSGDTADIVCSYVDNATITGNIITNSGSAFGHPGILITGDTLNTIAVTGNTLQGTFSSGAIRCSAVTAASVSITGNPIKMATTSHIGVYVTGSTITSLALSGNATNCDAGSEFLISTSTVGLDSADYFSGSATFNPSNLADGAGETTTVPCSGAVLGDFAQATFSLDLQGITLTAWVSSLSTVSVRFQNETGGAIDLASGTLRVRVRPA